jgi:hypothetical protein
MSTHGRWFEEENEEAARKNPDGTPRKPGMEIHAHVFDLSSDSSSSEISSKIHQVISKIVADHVPQMDTSEMLMNACINLEAVVLRAKDPSLAPVEAFQKSDESVQRKARAGTLKDVTMQSATIFAQCAMNLKKIAESMPDG